MISRFFIDRPIFAAVLSIVITLAGGIALFLLPLSLYPPISPPTVSVDCSYPGASARVVAETVATPIEQQVNGVENMMYMSSQCTNDGAYNLTVTFKHGVNLNMAQVLVQNRVALALPNLPDVLKQTGVNVRKRSPDILMAIAINSPTQLTRLDLTLAQFRPAVDLVGRLPGAGPLNAFALAVAATTPTHDQLFLSNFALLHVKDELARLPGVSEVNMLGQRDYSMRIWVDPDKLASRDMTANDVVAAIRAQNFQVATGQIGQPPAGDDQVEQIPLSTLGRLTEPEEFEQVVVKTGVDGRIVRVRDVARVELGAKNQDISGQVNGRPSVSLAIFQLPDANALDVADTVKEKIKQLASEFPPGVSFEIRYDTTPFIRESIGEVFNTLRDAIILVAVVVLLFLQNWRSALIPLVAVPVAVIGTFAVMSIFGFSLNNLTLFGLVLAIGIVVDDAIVVVEAVEHHIEHGLAPRAATIRAMEQVSGPVIAIGLVLSAVFVPCAFITGIVGQFFRQFALTIATSTIISAFNSLTLSPALAALLLRPRDEETGRNVLPWGMYGVLGGWIGWEWVARRVDLPWLAGLSGRLGHAGTVALVLALAGLILARPLDALLARFFRLFDRTFKVSTRLYGRVVRGLMRVSALVLVVYVGLLGLTYVSFVSTPTGFIPSQDMGYLLCSVQLPDSASNERTRSVMSRLEQIAKATPGVKHTQAMSGQSLLLSANNSNFGSMFVILDEFSKRPNPVTDRFFTWFEETVTRVDQRIEGLYRFLSDPPPAARPTPRAVRKEEGGRLFEKGERVGPTLSDRVRPWIPFRRTLRVWLGPTDDPTNPAAGPRMDRLRRAIDPPALEATVRRWLNRPKKTSLYGDAVADELRKRFGREVDDAVVTVLGPPPVRGVGRAGGFKILIEDRGDNGPTALQEQTDNIAELCKTQPGPGGVIPGLVGLTTVFRANVPQIYVDVDRKACMSKGVLLRDLFDTMRVYLGSLYVNDFNRFGRTWQVVVQADARFRNSIDDVRRLRVRNQQGEMVPLGTLAEVREENGPLVLTRYNMYPAAPINGAAAPGVSSGDAIKLVEHVCHDPDYGLPQSFSFEWTELAYLELQAGNTAIRTFGFAVIAVFLVLAAQYESWSLPMAVILVVPMCLLSAVTGVMMTYQDMNIFTQIGFVVLVGLASKNAILIVEFAKARREAGESRVQAALDACTLRLRPIVMTSFAFILGVLPLLLSEGAGAEMRRTLGTTVFSGMLGVTLFGIFLTPVFFVTIDWLGTRPALMRGPLRKVSDALLWVLSFGWLGLAARLVVTPGGAVAGRLPRDKPAAGPLDEPTADGHAPWNGDEPRPPDSDEHAPVHVANGDGDGDGDGHVPGSGHGNGRVVPEATTVPEPWPDGPS